LFAIPIQCLQQASEALKRRESLFRVQCHPNRCWRSVCHEVIDVYKMHFVKKEQKTDCMQENPLPKWWNLADRFENY